MTSNEYPPPAEHDPRSESEPNPEQTGSGSTEGVEPYRPVFEPGGSATAGYPSAEPSPYSPFASQQDQSPYGAAQPTPPAQAAYPAQEVTQPQYPTQELGQPQYPAQQSYPGPTYAAQPPYSTQPVPGQGYQPTGFGGYPVAGDAGYPGQPAPEPERRSRRGRLLLITALLAALIGGGVGGGIVALANHDSNSTNTGLKITNATGAPAAKVDGTIGAAASTIRPSVVTLNVTGAQESGTGSGVIIRADGYILTNDHVVSIAGSTGTISAILSDGRTATGKIVGRDNSDDLAVVKVDGLSNLTAATFAKSSSLSVGQSVVAVGAPLGLSDTVTSGIVSNLARPVRAGDTDQAVFEAVQTDAAINPGNSGGPLVDLNGSVVGINAAIASDNSGGGGLQIPGQQAAQAGNIGIGFAIPADEASRIASELIANGKATHAVLGVSVPPDTTASQATAGVKLQAVTAGGVGAKAGLKAGDVVTAIDGQQVTTSDGLIAAVRNNAPGQQVKVTYTRGGKSSDVTVTLGSSDS